MNGYCAFFKKEMMENLRTYKFLILALVFLALGIMSPLSAKYLPDLVAAFLPEGANLGIGEPAILDSWAQFFKNVPQIGLIVLVILFSTMLSAEFTKGTLVNFVTKGLSRSGVILAKSTAALLIWFGLWSQSALRLDFLENALAPSPRLRRVSRLGLRRAADSIAAARWHPDQGELRELVCCRRSLFGDDAPSAAAAGPGLSPGAPGHG